MLKWFKAKWRRWRNREQPAASALPATINAPIEKLEAAMLELPQVDCPLIHRFAPGVYLRTITMPAGSLIVGHKHLTKHGNVVLRGSALVSIAGKIQEIKAPHVFISDVGVRKVLYIKEEMEWMTIHPSESQNLDELELQLIEKSDTFNAHKAALELAENVAKTPREVLK